jgi:hypothetical protein
MGFLGAAARSAGPGASSGRGSRFARYLNAQTRQGALIAAISGGLFWLVWIYGNGLRDPSYFNGWMLASGMSLQVYFHIALKTASMSPKSAMRWRKIHIFLGYLLIAAFLSHTDFSLPDSGFEWALWMGFVLVSLSGIFGTYLSWSLKAKRRIEEGISYDRIPTRYAELARELHAIVSRTDLTAAQLALPAAPHDAWIKDLYTNHLREFFQGQRNAAAHLMNSQRPLKRLTDEINNLSNYVDKQSQEKLATIRDLVVEKDRLDFARLFLGLNKGWLIVHVPFTYSLIVLVVLHVIVAYSFSSGAL